MSHWAVEYNQKNHHLHHAKLLAPDSPAKSKKPENPVRRLRRSAKFLRLPPPATTLRLVVSPPSEVVPPINRGESISSKPNPNRNLQKIQTVNPFLLPRVPSSQIHHHIRTCIKTRPPINPACIDGDESSTTRAFHNNKTSRAASLQK
ncbi:hypothetical protein V8G54_013184 [Vigna mungo]|uniref:Uncharacterized protein n=1 Tax=Vigna mungo TaxID=3915 RepID=A0AAQ3S428_VIGMU